MFHKLLVVIVRLLPVGVLLEALPSVHVSLTREPRSAQIASVYWSHGGPGRHRTAKLERSGPCFALFTMGKTVLQFDVHRAAGALAMLRITEVFLDEPNHVDFNSDGVDGD